MIMSLGSKEEARKKKKIKNEIKTQLILLLLSLLIFIYIKFMNGYLCICQYSDICFIINLLGYLFPIEIERGFIIKI